MRQIEKKFFVLIERAKELGLSDKDALAANEFVEYREYGLSFDTVVTQLYEYDIPIDNNFFEMVCEIGVSLELPRRDYSLMAELIK